MCEAIDGEKDPQCLMIVFHLVELLAPLFPSPSGPLASDASDLFEVIGCYFPLHFTHVSLKPILFMMCYIDGFLFLSLNCLVCSFFGLIRQKMTKLILEERISQGDYW
jgi:hypothetical protein